MSELSKILTEANTEKWSLREIENQAARHGHKLNFTTAGKYLNGTHGRPTAEVIDAFAAVFGIQPSLLRFAAGIPASGEPFILPAEASQLTGPEREAIKHLVRVMVESKAHAAAPASRPRGERLPPSPGNRSYKLADGRDGAEGNIPLPADYYDLAAHPRTDSPGMREHAAGEQRGEESQDFPED